MRLIIRRQEETMKKLIVVVALLLAGCQAGPQVVMPDPRGAIAESVAKCATAIQHIASTGQGDAASKVAAVGAIERMCGGGGASMQFAMHQPAQQQPQTLGQTLWTAALQTADIFLRGYGIRASRDVSINAANNATATAIAGYSAFGNIASAGFNSNAAIASYIQAPQANVTTTNTTTTNTTNNTTLSGYGVIGAGTYIGPVARNCNGGSAGDGGNASGANPGAPGGMGGGSNGGSC